MGNWNIMKRIETNTGTMQIQTKNPNEITDEYLQLG